MGVLNSGGMGVTQSLPPLLQFKVREIMPSALSPTGTWGNTEKFMHYMAFLLIAPNKTIEGKGCLAWQQCGHTHSKPTTPLWVRQHVSSDC